MESNPPNEVIYVQALYSYSYTDDTGVEVSMEAGENYRLLCKGSEWWQVCRLDSEVPFYVPCTYVSVLEDDAQESDESEAEHVEVETGSDNSSSPDINTNTQPQQQKSPRQGSTQDNEGVTTFKNRRSMDMYSNGDEESLYQNFTQVPRDVGSENASGFKVQHLTGKMVRSSSEPQDDYVNLDEFRKDAGLLHLNTGMTPSQQPASPGSPDSQGESDYANLEQIRAMCDDRPPLPDNAVLQKTLLNVWNMYLDPVTNRIFYVNKETQDRTWIPPRDKNLPGTHHYEAKQMKEKGPTTKSNGDIPEKMTTSLQMVPANPAPPQVSDRIAKARSMIVENLHFSAPPPSGGHGPPKSATLPPNLCTPIFEAHTEPGLVSSSKGSKPDPQVPPYPTTQSFQLNEPIEGTLHRIKLEKTKKASKKGSPTYVKLAGSNLLFYKDQKSSQAKQSKYEQIISLMTARVELNPKEFSRKNSILITTQDTQVLLYCEDFVKIQEWHIKLQNTIRERGGEGANDAAAPPEAAVGSLHPPEEPSSGALGRVSSFKKGHKRSPSELEKDKQEKGRIKFVLLNFLSNRQKIQQLEAKGIYKDAVFGSELKVLCEREKQRVPSFVQRAITAIEKRGLEHEGLYRLSGNMATIQKLRCMVDQGDKYDLDDPSFDVHVLTGALKLFFRELKEPLFTFSLFDRFLKAIMKDMNSDKLRLMKATVGDLPKNHYETMRVFFRHLLKVMDQSSENKMQAQNIAIVMGPTLIWPQEPSQNMATMMVYQGRIVEYILLEYKNIFR